MSLVRPNGSRAPATLHGIANHGQWRASPYLQGSERLDYMLSLHPQNFEALGTSPSDDQDAE
jgi:hypothetical protein